MALVAVCGRARRCHLVIAGQSPIRGVAPGSRCVRGRGGVAVRTVCDSESSAGRGMHGVIGAIVVALMTVLVATSGNRSREAIPAGSRAMALRTLHGCSV